MVEDTAQGPHVHLRIVGLRPHLGILDLRRQLHLLNLRQHFSLSFVVTRHLEGPIECATRGIVQQAITHKVEDVLEIHVADIPSVYRLHDPLVLDPCYESLTKRVTWVSRLLDDLHNASALVVGTRLVLANPKGPLLELDLNRGFDLRGVRGVEVVPTRDDHLRGHELQRPNELVRHQRPRLRPVARSEVNQLHNRLVHVVSGVGAEEDVVGLQVPVQDIAGMQVLNGTHHLLKDVLGLLLRHRARLLQQVPQFATLGQLHHYHLPLCPLNWKGVDELNNVWVLANVGVNLNLSVQNLCVSGEDLLDGKFPALHVRTFVDLAITTSSQQIVLIKAVAIPKRHSHDVAAWDEASTLPCVQERQ
mmetsp:Transcript_2278/g.5174  ORF Transcript_2278/g.5174 Transcript_2278/m.5174 type:complete len:362 (-) Transcript_2278:136-1221(-)